jgi:hypothetical protein
VDLSCSRLVPQLVPVSHQRYCHAARSLRPCFLCRNEAFAAPNERFLEVEAPVKRVIRTTSTFGGTTKILNGDADLGRSGQLSPIKQFTLTPEEINFGKIKVGETAQQVRRPGTFSQVCNEIVGYRR